MLLSHLQICSYRRSNSLRHYKLTKCLTDVRKMKRACSTKVKIAVTKFVSFLKTKLTKKIHAVHEVLFFLHETAQHAFVVSALSGPFGFLSALPREWLEAGKDATQELYGEKKYLIALPIYYTLH